ncbi:MAG TPA: bifunctional phosphopantothenoylcysteine decarboxylase/phosphopantothenate--cysteine ligase CoaBC, partial [Candidatus Berkiella sp.]|nr:bifunctional phosphopantothenoylcysteine decarboxylase/phosphopantothenate--cysteine ligase CoaBC [Candidatus Berkiella sp.]
MMQIKRWLVGITGGIAAYKIPELVRLIKKQGCEVRVVLSHGAKAFVTPLTLQAISANPVYSELLDADFEAAMGHIELARWAQGVLIAPLSANRLAALAHGFADDLLTTLCLATTAPLYVAPAMNQHMWQHPATQANLEKLKARGVQILGPDWGEQACGEVGYGRMLEPQAIINILADNHLSSQSESILPLQDLQILITAG